MKTFLLVFRQARAMVGPDVRRTRQPIEMQMKHYAHNMCYAVATMLDNVTANPQLKQLFE